MVEKLGGIVVGFVFLIELDDLEGRKLFKNYDVKIFINY